jgi:hypothetical protein
MQNGLRTRNKHYFIFSIDNLNNLATKMANKKTLKKYDTEQTCLLSFYLTPLKMRLVESQEGIGWGHPVYLR